MTTKCSAVALQRLLRENMGDKVVDAATSRCWGKLLFMKLDQQSRKHCGSHTKSTVEPHKKKTGCLFGTFQKRSTCNALAHVHPKPQPFASITSNGLLVDTCTASWTPRNENHLHVLQPLPSPLPLNPPLSVPRPLGGALSLRAKVVCAALFGAAESAVKSPPREQSVQPLCHRAYIPGSDAKEHAFQKRHRPGRPERTAPGVCQRPPAGSALPDGGGAGVPPRGGRRGTREPAPGPSGSRPAARPTRCAAPARNGRAKRPSSVHPRLITLGS